MKTLLNLAALGAAIAFSPWSLAQDVHLARNLAATCANCHGTDGKATGAMSPLAGYPAAKLTAAMAEFKSGKRPATIMHQISRGYTEPQVALIAAYFAQQKP